MTEKPSLKEAMPLSWGDYMKELPTRKDLISEIYGSFTPINPSGKDLLIQGSMSCNITPKVSASDFKKLYQMDVRIDPAAQADAISLVTTEQLRRSIERAMQDIGRAPFIGDRVRMSKAGVAYRMYNPVTGARETVIGLNMYDYERSGWLLEATIDAAVVCVVCGGAGTIPCPGQGYSSYVLKKETCWHCDGIGTDPSKCDHESD